jgi:Ser/Thr protein kinase RdoA (MazF antagonist)
MAPFPSSDPFERDQIVWEVLCQILSVKLDANVRFLHNHGGFSGARLWRVESPDGWLCLRAWPPLPSLEDYLLKVHRLMELARFAGLSFVPSVHKAAHGKSYVQHAGRFWDLTMWMPGLADFHLAPSSHRLAGACAALARLHQAWRPETVKHAPCPAIQRRLQTHDEWQSLLASGWRPATSGDPADPCADSAERAWRLLARGTQNISPLLAPWADRAVPVQPCHCDLWHNHVLFEKDEVAGLVDYGSVKIDHVAVDLARLLGSMAGNDYDLWAAGLAGYRTVRPLAEEEVALVHVLDRTGTLVAMANWLKWLYLDKRVFPDRLVVARRLTDLVNRAATWQ